MENNTKQSPVPDLISVNLQMAHNHGEQLVEAHQTQKPIPGLIKVEVYHPKPSKETAMEIDNLIDNLMDVDESSVSSSNNLLLVFSLLLRVIVDVFVGVCNIAIRCNWLKSIEIIRIPRNSCSAMHFILTCQNL